MLIHTVYSFAITYTIRISADHTKRMDHRYATNIVYTFHTKRFFSHKSYETSLLTTLELFHTISMASTWKFWIVYTVLYLYKFCVVCTTAHSLNGVNDWTWVSLENNHNLATIFMHFRWNRNPLRIYVSIKLTHYLK